MVFIWCVCAHYFVIQTFACGRVNNWRVKVDNITASEKIIELDNKHLKKYGHRPIYLILSHENRDKLQKELGYDLAGGIFRGMVIAIVNNNEMDFADVV